MARETHKALKRRFAEADSGGFPWRDVFKGRGLDIGAGDDPLPFKECTPWDTKDGDANKIINYFPPQSFDYIHSSHCLEHLFDARESLRNWVSLVKHGGYVCFTVPDVGAYENFTYPSKYNPDHKASFSMVYRGSCFPAHHHIPTLLATLDDCAEVLIARYVEVNYDWKQRDRDQTWKVEDACEIWNEVLLKRRTL